MQDKNSRSENAGQRLRAQTSQEQDFQWQIAPEDEGQRIDRWISDTLENLSRSYIQKCIAEEGVFVNDVPRKASYRLRVDDEIRFRIPPAAVPEIKAEDIPLSILYEDKDILIVDKPKGMVVHPAPGHYTGTLVNAVLYHCGNDLSGIGGVLRPGIVHRIDKDTTGALVICKNDAAHQALAMQLKEHSVTRKYRAIVCGVLPDEEGTIDAPLGRDPKDRKKMAVTSDGKRAVTHYKVLERFSKYTYAECALETGRTHQIRVHMAHIGHPVLGDPLYASGKCPFSLDGQTLHAMTLGLRHPRTNAYVEVTAALPAYFQHLLEILR